MSADPTPHWKVYLCANCGESNYHANNCVFGGAGQPITNGSLIEVVPASALDDLRAENERLVWKMGEQIGVAVRERDEARAERDRLRADLALIAGTDPIDAVLDPDRALRVARAALAVPAPPTTPEKNDA